MRREWVETNHSFKFVHLIILLLLRIRSTLPIFVQRHTPSLPQILRHSFLGNEVSELGVDGVKAEDGIFGRTSAGESLLPFEHNNPSSSGHAPSDEIPMGILDTLGPHRHSLRLIDPVAAVGGLGTEGVSLVTAMWRKGEMAGTVVSSLETVGDMAKAGDSRGCWQTRGVGVVTLAIGTKETAVVEKGAWQPCSSWLGESGGR